LGELASAWAGDRRGIIPTFLITVFTEDGYAETKAVNIEWIKLAPLSVNTFTLEPKNKRKRFLRIQESMTCPETYRCDYCAVMVDTFQYSGRVLLMKAVTNENQYNTAGDQKNREECEEKKSISQDSPQEK